MKWAQTKNLCFIARNFVEFRAVNLEKFVCAHFIAEVPGLYCTWGMGGQEKFICPFFNQYPGDVFISRRNCPVPSQLRARIHKNHLR